MPFFKKIIYISLSGLFFCNNAYPNYPIADFDINKVIADYQNCIDTIGYYYFEDFMCEQEELVEDHPADNLYNNIWTRSRVNPYEIDIDQISDSILINCSEFVLPVTGAVTSKFGLRGARFHYGTDLRLRTGDPVKSAFSGKIRIIGYQRSGYGHYIVIRHKNGLETVYAHLSKVLVKHDQEIEAGEVIGLGGNTGRSFGSHLHFEIRYLGNAFNPEKMIIFGENGYLQQEKYLLTKNDTFEHQTQLKALRAIRYHTIRKGETLGAIARKYGTSVNTLCRLNGISSTTTIRAGRSLRIR